MRAGRSIFSFSLVEDRMDMKQLEEKVKDKMKTQIGKIPWDNYCMRKYGENLFQSLRQIIINNAVIEKINRDIQIALRLKARGFFVNLGKPLSDVPLKPRSGKDRRR